MVVGSTRTVSAATPAAIGEKTYAFVSWSDGAGAEPPVHRDARPGEPDRDVPAHRRRRARRAAGRRRPQASIGAWFGGTTRTAGDVDWYRFALTKAPGRPGRPRRPAAQRTSSSCTTPAGRCSRRRITRAVAPEEIVRTLPAGTYSIRVSGHGGFDIADPYQVRIRPLGTSAVVLSSTSTVGAGHAPDRRRGAERVERPARAGHRARPALRRDRATSSTTWTKAAYVPVLDALGPLAVPLHGAARRPASTTPS